MRRFVLSAIMATAACTMAVPAAEAGRFENLYTGLRYIVTPLGLNNARLSDGSVVNGARLGRVRIVPNAGSGYRVEIDRTFGVDSRGRAEVLDLGIMEVELAGSTQSTFGYTNRGLWIGSGETFMNNLNYRMAVKTGGYDGTVSGTVNLANSFEVNELGFYTLELDIANDNSLLEVTTLDGYEQEELDFDIGPIAVQGNIYFDMIIGVLNLFGVDVSDLSSLSGIDQLNDAVNSALEQGTLAAGYQLSIEDDQVNLDPVETPSAQNTPPVANVVPEPTSAALILAGLLLVRRR